MTGKKPGIVDLERPETTFPLCSSEQGEAARPVAFSPANKRLAVAFAEGGLGMCDVKSGRLLWRHGWLGANSTVFSHDGRSVALVSGGIVRVLDALTGNERIEAHGLELPREAVLTPDGTRAVIESTGYVSVWSTDQCTLERTFPKEKGVSRMVASKGSRYVLGGGDGRFLARLDLETGDRKSLALSFHPGTIGLSANGKTAVLLSHGSDNPELVVVDVEAMAMQRKQLTESWSHLLLLVVADDAKQVHVVGFPGGFRSDDRATVAVLDLATGKTVRSQKYDIFADVKGILLHEGKVLHLAADDDQNRFALDTRSGKPVKPRDAALLETSADGSVGIWVAGDGLLPLSSSAEWPAEPKPTSPRDVHGPDMWTSEISSVGGARILRCLGGSCVVTGP